MRIVLALLFYDKATAALGPERYLETLSFDRALGTALARAGHHVEMVLLSPFDASIEREGVPFHFVAAGRAARAIGSLGARFGQEPSTRQPALRAIDVIARLRPDVVHFHGTTLHLNLALLAARSHGRALVVQYHGGGAARGPLARALQRFGLARADRVLFTSAAQARPFIDAGVLAGPARVAEIPEVSTLLRPPPRDEARRLSGLVGDPLFLCAGRLHPVKDPLTVLRGFEIVARRWPGARLYFCYLSDELLPALLAEVARSPLLASRVTFLGLIAPTQMEAVLGSADFLLQASLREVASYAVIEAISAGVLPVVTRIDAFEAITEGGRHGVLFPPGDAEALARGVLAVDLATLPARRLTLRAHFDAHLSFSALARRLEAIYTELLTPPAFPKARATSPSRDPRETT